MTFKFHGYAVSFIDGVLLSDNEPTMAVLAPLVGLGSGAPEDGDPLLNTICSIFGVDSVTDLVEDDYDPFLIH